MVVVERTFDDRSRRRYVDEYGRICTASVRVNFAARLRCNDLLQGNQLAASD
jgi:hypothetical protein